MRMIMKDPMTIFREMSMLDDKEQMTNYLQNLERVPLDEEQNPQKNADRLDAMSIEEKAQFLHSIAYNRETPWCKPFYEKFCKDCPAPEYTLDDGRKLCLHECDFKDGKCPHGTDIVWWLQQPSK